MYPVKVTTETTIDLSVEVAAQWFCGLTDDEQCRFFVAVAKITKDWPDGGDGQWYHLGGHLKNCECSTDEARGMIRALARYMETSTHR